ncbi:TKL family protein kinase [Trichomonas vaginalis G3]|uniref:TKL family protein kinase n=1 Tax=Trichomonas vaginalis (strain ATCC PRA-98 / G3) TaxID=412133 RepID=A2FBK8_TRIV3|nr:protein kinase protein [Trichomonas vaginalis G3]EAX97694.1 TKL family protein kinase [Trichomonas vaginalis G3]KAI5497075.1 protein kinase protein [Trichomonas vaginalis G3]|eukprot:XP_001310624.1 TKL family protein kinase [Trichomonas vaginalis G3]
MELTDEQREFLMDPNDYQEIRELPSSGFSRVVLMEEKTTKHQVVFKYAKLMIESASEDDPVTRKMFYNKVYQSIKQMHPCINPTEGFCPPTKEGIPIIVSTYASNGFLDDRNIVNANPTKKLLITIGLAAALKFLHNQRIFDLNIKPSNILIDKNYYPMITDYNYTRFNNNPHNPCMNVGTVLYLSPEHITQEYVVSPKSDIFSFAWIIYRLFCHRDPFQMFNDPLECVMKFSQGWRPEIPNTTAPVIQDIIQQCWSQNPDARPTASALFDMLCMNISNIINDLNEQAIILYLRAILDYDNGIACQALGDDRGKFEVARILYLSHTSPYIQNLSMTRIKSYAEAGDRDAINFLSQLTGEVVIDASPEEVKKVTEKVKTHSHTKTVTRPKTNNVAIIEAAANGELEKVKGYLADNVDVNTQDENGDTALQVAARKGDLELVKYLIKVNGINLNTTNQKGYSPLHEAVRFSKTEVVYTLVKAPGIEMSIKDKMGYGPLDWATNDDMKNYLIKHGAKSRKIPGADGTAAQPTTTSSSKHKSKKKKSGS